jgi:hypothetical protein
MSAPMTEPLPWSAPEGFWYRHPLFAWTLQLAVAATLYAFIAPYVLGNEDEQAESALVFYLVGRALFALKKYDRAKRRLRPSPFFFWW